MFSTSFTKAWGYHIPSIWRLCQSSHLSSRQLWQKQVGLRSSRRCARLTPYLVDTVDKAASRAGAPIGVKFVIPFLNRETLKAVVTRVKVVSASLAIPILHS